MSRIVSHWSLLKGTLKVEYPDFNSFIEVSSDSSFYSARGRFSVSEWISRLFNFLSIYRKLLKS